VSGTLRAAALELTAIAHLSLFRRRRDVPSGAGDFFPPRAILGGGS
jgi:hypothetical protein